MTTIRIWTNYAKSGDQPPPQVQAMDLEEYLCGVVPHEMSPSAPREALKAQAVAARTYALATIRPDGRPRHGDAERADVCRTDHCQVWTAGTFPASDAAVMLTAGQYLQFNNKIATAYYFAHCGGRTNTPAQAGWPGQVPWCQPVECLCKPPRPAGNHGVGMCQDGAVLMAKRSYDYQMILNHYYTGVMLATAGVTLPPSPLGYNSQYVLMSQLAGLDVWATLAPYALNFRVTSGFSHDDALRVHGDRHTITILGSVGQPWSVSTELEQFLRQVAPWNITVERVEAKTLAELAARLQDCITKGNPLAYR